MGKDDDKKRYELRPVTEEETYFRKMYRMLVDETSMEMEAKKQEKYEAEQGEKPR